MTAESKQPPSIGEGQQSATVANSKQPDAANVNSSPNDNQSNSNKKANVSGIPEGARKIEALHPPKSNQGASNHGQGKSAEADEDKIIQRDLRDYTKSLSVYTLVLAIATGSLVVLGAIQLYFLSVTVRDTGVAADAAQKSAEAASRTVKTMDGTAEKQLRAYVSALPDFIVSFDETEFARFTFKLHNTGPTPARLVRHRSNVIVAPYPLKAGDSFPPITSDFGPPVVVFPNLVLIGGGAATTKFDKTEIAKVISGGARIYVYGEITYEDVFGHKQTTTFCASAKADSATLTKLTSRYKPSDLVIHFESAPMGNDAT